ncbi:unnamed protein product [Spirodela intermedia]|uniref:RING-type E3 ubiquitin transferase n=1 Tax=Spirodela intermedia TaxID=51605 RepID=A0A7I8L9D9_SPIIN|nr:unnamed protein product [Spirodela intermedia]
MGSPNYNQQTGLQIDDCSLGFCSVYCPQWCFIVQKPPPPFGPPEDAAGSPGFSPLFIIVIGILASAFMLILYYAVITRYCSRFDPLGRRRSGGDSAAAPPLDWYYSPAGGGLEESLIRSLGEIKFVNGEGIVGTCDCSVCLGEFQEGEALRLLPKCTHAFHLPCIDMWLRSHSTCPLCRTNVVAPPVQPTSSPELQREAIATDPEDAEEEEGGGGEDDRGDVEGGGVHHELGDPIGGRGVQAIRRSLSVMDASRLDLESSFPPPAAKEPHHSAAEHVEGPSAVRKVTFARTGAPMKRSFSCGRFAFTRHSSWSHSILPL